METRHLPLVVLLIFVLLVVGLISWPSESEHKEYTPNTRTMVPLFRAQPVEHTGAGGLPRTVRKLVMQQKEQLTPETTSTGSENSWQTLSFAEVAALWQSGNPSFTDVFAASLAAVPFEAIFWESAPVTNESMGSPYEFVVVNAPRLARVSADDEPFSEFLAQGEGTTDVVTFHNLRGDARLVSPCRSNPADAYAHIAKFVRAAPRDQIVKFFAAVGAALEAEVESRRNGRPVWLSTSGLGVSWLHARLDSTPKYYTYTPYKAWSDRG